MKSEVAVPLILGGVVLVGAVSLFFWLAPVATTFADPTTLPSTSPSTAPTIAEAISSPPPPPPQPRKRPTVRVDGLPDPKYKDVPLSVWVSRTEDLDDNTRLNAIRALLDTRSEPRSMARLDELVAGPTTIGALMACQRYSVDTADVVRHLAAAVQPNAYIPDLETAAGQLIYHLDPPAALEVLKAIMEADGYAKTGDEFNIALVAKITPADAKALLADPKYVKAMSVFNAVQTRTWVRKRALD